MKLFFYTLIFALVFSAPLLAGESIATYNAYGAGMHLMSGTMHLKTNKKNVFIETKTQTQGLLSILLNSKTTLTSSFKKRANKLPVVQNSQMKSILKREIKNRHINLANKPNVLDYQTAIYDIMQQKTPQTKEYIVFDGKRKMNFTFNYQGIKEINSTKDLIYSGAADYYTLSIDIIEGKKKGWFFNRVKNKKNPPLHLYFAKLNNEQQKRLVRAEFDTSLFGTISINLSHLTEQ